MITAFFAALLALLMCWLALQVIRARRRNQVRYGDAGVTELQQVRAAHSNAVDYIPIFLILLGLLEFNGAPVWLVVLPGVCFTLGRFIHCRAILTENLKGRVLGMQFTLFTLIATAVVNLVYVPYGKFL